MVKRNGISQETLKLLACVTMLIDHIGAVLLPGALSLRVIGRVAFPIYCFLLSEGVCHTRSPKKYALRLGIGAILSELPFDLALFGRFTWNHQSVMITLLLGFFALETFRFARRQAWKPVFRWSFSCAAAALFFLLVEALRTDYGGAGILMIALFYCTRELPRRGLLRLVGLTALVYWQFPGGKVALLGASVPIELYALAALIPIGAYRGRKRSHSAAVQWAFYLFYPVHLTILYLLSLG